jgi:hypothetical protein
VIGEKARSLEERGRSDVIEAMAGHDIGSHTNFGSIHPTVTEILEKKEMQEGTRVMLENESAGFEELERIFQVPVRSLARHGGSYGPQLINALGEMGKAYVYSPFRLPGKHAMWFCNALNFYGDYGYYDDFYFNDELFEPVFDTLKQNFLKDTRGTDVISFFAGHPTKIRAEQFWDFNFYEGANPGPDELEAPELRPAESMETAKKNFRRLMQFLKEQDHIEITTYSELVDRFSYQPPFVRKKDLERIASAMISEKRLVMDDLYNPAETFAAWVEAIHQYAKDGKVPKKLTRVAPLGPLTMPSEMPELARIRHDQALELAAQARNYIMEQGALPAGLTLNGKTIGTGTQAHLFARLYLDALKGKLQPEYELIAFEPYPREHEKSIVSTVEDFKHWIVHRPDLDMSHLADLTRMQLWTLKPAFEP